MESYPQVQAAYNRDYVRLLMVMRRFIKEEFNVDIRISEEDAGIRMLEHGERSRNRVLREMALELREHLPGLANEPTAEAPPPSEGSEAAAPAPPKGKAARIYRGRPVYD